MRLQSKAACSSFLKQGFMRKHSQWSCNYPTKGILGIETAFSVLWKGHNLAVLVHLCWENRIPDTVQFTNTGNLFLTILETNYHRCGCPMRVCIQNDALLLCPWEGSHTVFSRCGNWKGTGKQNAAWRPFSESLNPIHLRREPLIWSKDLSSDGQPTD